jgi:hypothetical protein
MEFSIITIAVLAVLAIVFLVGMIKAFSDVHWLHLVLLFLTFVSTIAGGILLSRSYRIRSAWRMKYLANEKIIEQINADLDLYRSGPLESTSAPLNSVQGATAALREETYGQGRVWSSVRPEVQGGNIVVTLPTSKPEDNGGFTNDAPANQLQQRMLVYVFRDAPIPDHAYSDPTQSNPVNLTPPSPPINGASLFLGIMQVTAVEGDKVTLKKTNTLDIADRRLKLDAQGQVQFENGKPIVETEPIFPEIANEFAAPSSTWSLYETSPVDDASAFKRLRESLAKFDPTGEAGDFDTYQKEYREELTKLIPPSMLGLDLNTKEDAIRYEAVLDRFAFDRMRVAQINRWIEDHKNERLNPVFSPAPEERFVLLKFKAQSKDYEVDSNAGSVNELGIFDTNGRAVFNYLWAAQDGTGKVHIDKDEIVLVDPQSAENLRKSESVEDVGEVYVRKLFDYPSLLSNYVVERQRLFDILLRLVDEIEKLKATNAELQVQERDRTKLDDQLNQDMSNLQTDVQTIEALRDHRRQEIVALKGQINELHRNINARYEQIKQRSMQLMNTSR